jgi:hypothetical protein
MGALTPVSQWSTNTMTQRKRLAAALPALIAMSAAALTTPALAGGQDAAPPVPTQNPAFNVQYIDAVDGAVVALWNEQQPDGQVVPFYSVAFDGRNFSRAVSTDYHLQLRYAVFDPAASAIPEAPAGLEADASNRLYMVQFFTQPFEMYQNALTGMGATVRYFLAHNALIVDMTPEVREAVSSLGYVRWVGPLHPAYKLDGVILDAYLAGMTNSAMEPYSVQGFGRGMASQQKIADRLTALGGQVTNTAPDGFRMTVTMTMEHVLDIVRMNEVHFIEPWGPGETDLDVVRQIGGASTILAPVGITGQGVRGEIFDTENDMTHPEWNGQPPLLHGANGNSGSHGTACYGNCFSTGVVNPQATGLCPSREQGIFCWYPNSTQFGGATTRLQLNTEATDPNGQFRSVFQTSSVGSPRTTQYTTISAETDDYLFMVDYLSCQSQSNANLTPDSRPQAWAKNIVSVGGITHQNTLTRNDDTSSGSTGPASDNRIKPDLAHFYDNTFTTWPGGGYTQFSGTSNATPCTAGHFGLLFQMWHEEVFPGHGGGNSVFEDRCKSTTAKALMINTAFKYDWYSPGVPAPNTNMFRDRQGWGMADLGKLYENREKITIIDETDLIEPLGVNAYISNVPVDEPELAVTMIYLDPAGNPASNIHRINDLTLKVTSPSGVVYWGNNGLRQTNWSSAGGSANDRDTVENVFIQNPEPGPWSIEVMADILVADSHVETPALDADYALIVRGGTPTPPALTLRVIEAPSGLLPDGSAPAVEAEIVPGTENIVPGSQRVYYRYDGGVFNFIVLSPIGNDRYAGNLPAVGCNDTPEFYFSVEGDGGTTLTAPRGAPANLFSFDVGEIVVAFEDNFETDQGWTVVNQNLATGAWVRAIPIAPTRVQEPPGDYDGSGRCFVTGNTASQDVDGGPTIQTSPVFDLSSIGNPVVSYARWMATNSTDELVVEVSDNNGGAWVTVETVSTPSGWVESSFVVEDFVQATSQVRVRFSISDNPNDSVTEGGVDAFSITAFVCGGCDPCDTNCDGVVDAFDIESFIALLTGVGQPCASCSGDTNGDGVIDAFDIEPFISCLTGP